MSCRFRVAGQFAAGLVASLCLAAPAAPQQAEPPSDLKRDVFRAETEVVLLDVVVRDKKGRTVRDLRADELEVYENGAKQAIGSFRFLDSRALGEAMEEAKQEGTTPEARPAPRAPAPRSPGTSTSSPSSSTGSVPTAARSRAGRPSPSSSWRTGRTCTCRSSRSARA